MHIALSREQIHVGRIFTLESCPFPGRSVYVAQKPLGASGNTWSLQRPRENEAEGAAQSRFVPVRTRVPRQEPWGAPAGSHGRAVAPAWALSGLVLGPNPEMLRGHPGGLRVPAVPKAPVPAVSKKLLLLCVRSFGKHIRVEHTCTGPRACAGTLLDPYLLQLIIYDYK